MLKITRKFVTKGYYKYNHNSKVFYLNAKHSLINHNKKIWFKTIKKNPFKTTTVNGYDVPNNLIFTEPFLTLMFKIL
jgi:hypothetical protein